MSDEGLRQNDTQSGFNPASRVLQGGGTPGVSSSTARSSNSFEGIDALESFDLYCRTFGARDLYELFLTSTEDGLLADKLRAEMPDFLNLSISRFFDVAGTNGLDLPSAEVPADWTNQDSIWEQVKNFFQGYIITNVYLRTITIPVFCVYPPDIDGGKCKLDYSRTSSKEMSFTIGIPGLNGGFGVVEDTSCGVEIEEFVNPYQYQTDINYNIFERRSESGDVKYSLSPLGETGTDGGAEEGTEEFIKYQEVSRHEIRSFKKRLNESEWRIHNIKRGHHHTFTFQADIEKIGGCELSIKSTVNDEFNLRFTGPGGHKYSLLGADRKSHDLIITCTKLPISAKRQPF